MDTHVLLKSAVQLLLSAVLAGFIGFEREMHGRPAGFRTHILVSVGSTLFTIASIGMAGMGHGDSNSRIAAQIVSGIGFLGAGTIIRQGNAIKGLTTAASLWAVAGVGLCIGAGNGLMMVGTVATVIIFITLTLVRKFESHFEAHREYREVTLIVTDPTSVVHSVIHALDEIGVQLIQSNLESGFGQNAYEFVIRLKKEGGLDTDQVMRCLSGLPNVLSVEWS